MEKNIFKNAKFGDKFRTRDGRMMLYLRKMPDNNDFHELLDSSINIEHYHSNGQYCEEYPLPCDIISEWQELIDEDKLDELAKHYAKTTYLEEGVGGWEDGAEAYIAGYRMAMEGKK